MRLSATGDHRHVGSGRPQEEAERPADTAEPRDPERRAHYQLSPDPRPHSDGLESYHDEMSLDLKIIERYYEAPVF